jgi:hypothetical protein
MSTFDKPIASAEQPPPPVFDSSFLPPPSTEVPPPAFDNQMLLPTAAPPVYSFDPLRGTPAAPAGLVEPPPPAFDSLSLAATPVVAPSAPSFDLLATLDSKESAGVWDPVTPKEEELDYVALAEALGLPASLTEADRNKLIDEQMQIMNQIETSKCQAGSPSPRPHSAAADAFESRSFQAAVQSIGGGSTRVNTSGKLGSQNRSFAVLSEHVSSSLGRFRCRQCPEGI